MQMKKPKTIRHTTLGDPQGLITPPKFNPIKIIKAKLRRRAIPIQSTAFRPGSRPVLGLYTCKQVQSIRNDTAEIGRLIHQFHLQETY